jgi:hypothetical protein
LSEIFFAVICPVADTAKEEEGWGAFFLESLIKNVDKKWKGI